MPVLLWILIQLGTLHDICYQYIQLILLPTAAVNMHSNVPKWARPSLIMQQHYYILPYEYVLAVDEWWKKHKQSTVLRTQMHKCECTTDSSRVSAIRTYSMHKQRVVSMTYRSGKRKRQLFDVRNCRILQVSPPIQQLNC